MSYGGAAAAPASETGKGAAQAAPPIDGHIAGAGSCITIPNRFGSASASSRGTRKYSAPRRLERDEQPGFVATHGQSTRNVLRKRRVRPTFHVDPLVTNECGDRSVEDVERFVFARASGSGSRRGGHEGAHRVAQDAVRIASPCTSAVVKPWVLSVTRRRRARAAWPHAGSIGACGRRRDAACTSWALRRCTADTAQRLRAVVLLVGDPRRRCTGAGLVIRDATGDCRLADDWCADLDGEVVSRLPTDEFRLEAANIVAWLDASPVARRARAAVGDRWTAARRSARVGQG